MCSGSWHIGPFALCFPSRNELDREKHIGNIFETLGRPEPFSFSIIRGLSLARCCLSPNPFFFNTVIGFLLVVFGGKLSQLIVDRL